MMQNCHLQQHTASWGHDNVEHQYGCSDAAVTLPLCVGEQTKLAVVLQFQKLLAANTSAGAHQHLLSSPSSSPFCPAFHLLLRVVLLLLLQQLLRLLLQVPLLLLLCCCYCCLLLLPVLSRQLLLCPSCHRPANSSSRSAITTYVIMLLCYVLGNELQTCNTMQRTSA
jgi:hypothetical protein